MCLPFFSPGKKNDILAGELVFHSPVTLPRLSDDRIKCFLSTPFSHF